MGVVEVLEDDYTFYFICELVKGGDLHDRLEDVKTFSEAEASYIIK